LQRKIKYVAFVLALLTVSVSMRAEDVQKDIIACETKMWQTFVGPQVDIEAFQRWLGWGYLDIDSAGVLYDGQENVPMLKSLTVSSFTMENPQVRTLSPNSAVITANIKWDGTRNGQKTSANVLSSTVWAKRNGRWQAQLHTETAAAAQR
jgi:Domain of unknown function (DUF4440)